MYSVHVRRILCVLMLISSIPFLSSCLSYRLKPTIVEERTLLQHEISRVAVIPFLNRTQCQGEIDTAADMFSSELARFREVSVVHPTAVQQFLAEQHMTLNEAEIIEQAQMIGEAFSVQAVIVGVITEADPFFPPTCGISLMVIDMSSGEPILSKSDVYDAHLNYVRNDVQVFASTRKIDDSLLRSDLILHRFDMYIRFVCHEMIKKYL